MYLARILFPDINLKNALYLSVNVFGTNSLSRHKFKKCALFECQCIWHECTNWEHYEVFLRTCLESGPPF